MLDVAPTNLSFFAMQQATDEGFILDVILDVLQNCIPYSILPVLRAHHASRISAQILSNPHIARTLLEQLIPQVYRHFQEVPRIDRGFPADVASVDVDRSPSPLQPN